MLNFFLLLAIQLLDGARSEKEIRDTNTRAVSDKEQMGSRVRERAHVEQHRYAHDSRRRHSHSSLLFSSLVSVASARAVRGVCDRVSLC